MLRFGTALRLGMAEAIESPRLGEQAEYQRLYARELQNEDALVVALMRRS
eukprot:COSAG04_NODE_15453_length_531_cov_1.270833_1_plen_49_part_10